jgi:hypothetical protein
MKYFTTFAFLLVAIPASIASVVEEKTIEKRTCGTLTGTALQICQDACEVACVRFSSLITTPKYADQNDRLRLLLTSLKHYARTLARLG